MIYNDSAAGHLAVAYGTPSLVIFWPVKAEAVAPRGKAEVKFVSHDFKCKPCTLPNCPLETEEYINSVKVGEVIGLFKNIYQHI